MWHKKIQFSKLDFLTRFVSFLPLHFFLFSFLEVQIPPIFSLIFQNCSESKQITLYSKKRAVWLTSKKSIQFNFSYLRWSTVWCCQKIEELKIENLWTKNSLFPCHTQTNLKYISWNGKNTVQSTSKMIFNFLNSYFDKKLYGLFDTIRHMFETVWTLKLFESRRKQK